MVRAVLLVDNVTELHAAARQNPEAFVRTLTKSTGPQATQMAIASLRPKLEQTLHKHGLQWEDVQRKYQVLEQDARAEADGGQQLVQHFIVNIDQRRELLAGSDVLCTDELI